jgi:type III pantothenate kinase
LICVEPTIVGMGAGVGQDRSAVRPDPHPCPTITYSGPAIATALVLDVGSSWTKAALSHPDGLTRLDAFPTPGAGWQACLSDLLTRAGRVDHVAVSSVAPAATRVLRRLAAQAAPVGGIRFVTAASAALAIDYRPVDALGADRVADAVAAVAGWGAPVVVADVGTAITCDVVDAAGRFVGGAIAPGPVTAYRGLVERLPRLAVDCEPFPAAADPPSTGTSTADCVRAGVLRGAAALVDGLVRGHQRLVGPCPVVVTGGLGPLLARLGETATAVDPDLTLRGIDLVCRAADTHDAPAA